MRSAKRRARYNGYSTMADNVPKHVLDQIRPLHDLGRTDEEIAYLLRIDLSIVRQALTTTHAPKRRKRDS